MHGPSPLLRLASFQDPQKLAQSALVSLLPEMPLLLQSQKWAAIPRALRIQLLLPFLLLSSITKPKLPPESPFCRCWKSLPWEGIVCLPYLPLGRPGLPWTLCLGPVPGCLAGG